MNTKDKATARPWNLEVNQSDGQSNDIIGKHGEFIATCHLGYEGDDANAELIVKAVNSHEALLEALASLVEIRDEGETINKITWENARQAIKDAE